MNQLPQLARELNPDSTTEIQFNSSPQSSAIAKDESANNSKIYCVAFIDFALN